MARIVLGLGSSHSSMLALPGEHWDIYKQRDEGRRELVYPPNGLTMSYEEAIASLVPVSVQQLCGDEETFKAQYKRCQVAIETLRDTLIAAKPDITVIISDDQDEWFYENNMPAISIYWGESAPLIPRPVAADAPDYTKQQLANYGDVLLEVPVPALFGRHVIDFLMDHDFDVSHFNYLDELHGGSVTRRYPTADGETNSPKVTEPHQQGLPHGFAFVVKRLFDNKPSPILPVFQNTCYPPNQVRPSRSYDLGRNIARAIESWDEDARVAVVASGGLSHWVVDEELDRSLISALEKKDETALRNMPRHRLYSAASESLNWIAAAGALADTDLNAEVVDYVPVYRSKGQTGGGWTFMRWQ